MTYAIHVYGEENGRGPEEMQAIINRALRDLRGALPRVYKIEVKLTDKPMTVVHRAHHPSTPHQESITYGDESTRLRRERAQSTQGT